MVTKRIATDRYGGGAVSDIGEDKDKLTEMITKVIQVIRK